MKAKSIFFFILAVAVSFLAASYRWGDSAHAIGVIKASGGTARHASVLASGEGTYTLIATAAVIPPYRGDARVVLEGEPRIDHAIYLSGPVVDLGLRRNPELRDNVICGLQPRDRIALWVVMKPPMTDPVCGAPYRDGFLGVAHEGRDYVFCCRRCAQAFSLEPERYRNNIGVRGRYRLAFYDTKTNRPVLNVPIEFQGKGESGDACEHGH